MSSEQLKLSFLSQIAPADFERLVTSLLLRHGFIEINPIGGVGDRGIDTKLFTFQHNETSWVVQISTEQYAKGKIEKTLKRLNTLPTLPSGLVYATSRHITNQQTESLQELALNHGVLLRIIDANWVCARTEITEDYELRPLRLTADITEVERKRIEVPALLDILIREATDSVRTGSPVQNIIVLQALAAGIESFHLRFFGKPVQALAQSARCYKLSRGIENLPLSLFACHIHGEALKGVKNFPKARLTFLEYMGYAKTTGDGYLSAVGITNLSETSNDLRARWDFSLEASDAFSRLDKEREYANTLGQQSRLALLNGDVSNSIRLAQASKKLSDSPGNLNVRGAIRAELHVSRAHLASGNFDACLETISMVDEQARQVGDLKTAAQAGLIRIECLIKLKSARDQIDTYLTAAFRDCFDVADYSNMHKLQKLLTMSRKVGT